MQCNYLKSKFKFNNMNKKNAITLLLLLLLSLGVNAQKWDELSKTPQMGWSSWNKFQGNINEVVPPNSAYATYNVVKGAKKLSVYPATGHFWFQEQWDEWQSWIAKQLKLEQ